MYKRSRVFLSALLLFAASAAVVGPCLAAGSPPAVGGKLPDFSLPAPQTIEESHYLGLADGAAFSIPQLKTRMVVIEIFNMYCPFCQKEAPNVNRLYQLIESNRAVRGKIKIIGIGAGNSAYEVNTFRKKYDVSFPLFTDEGYKLHKAWGEVRTPYFVVIQINPNGTHKVIYSKVGTIGSAEDFLGTLLKNAQPE